MKLWKLTRTDEGGWDTYDSAVVAAETEAEAAMIHPDGSCRGWTGQWDTWVPPSEVVVELIGEAIKGTQAGVICASFNAG